jgi:hypothetical protein
MRCSGQSDCMISPPFPITQVRNGWMVSWPGFRDISQVEIKQKLTDLIFDSIGVEEAQFGVRVQSGKTEFLHIQFNDWAADRSGIADNILDRIEITGVLFDTEQSAEWLQDYFEKKLMWKRLKQVAQ